jgi:molecular chaperone GrpE
MSKDKNNIENNEQQAKNADKKNKKEVDELQKKLNEVEEEASLYLDQLKRLKAEFDNYRKRMQKISTDNLKVGEKNVAKDVVVVLDNLQRALDHREVDYAGLELIKKDFYNILSQKGLKHMESEGKDFDHNYHHAVGFCEVDDDSMEDKIVEVLQQGYYWDDEVLRPAMVIVGKKKEQAEEKEEEIVKEEDK